MRSVVHSGYSKRKVNFETLNISVFFFQIVLHLLRVRGILGTLLTVSVNVGILIGYLGGTYLDYKAVPYVMMIFPILFIFVFLFMPNTPQYYIRSRRLGVSDTIALQHFVC